MNYKYHLLLFALIFCTVGTGRSQSYIFPARLADSTWHYYNQKGEVVIDRLLKDSYPFSEDGFAAVGQGRFVLLSRRGEILKTELGEKIYLKDIGGKFPTGFSGGFIIVEKDYLYGCLDTLGKLKIPFRYSNIMPFNNGYGTGRIENQYFIFNKYGKPSAIKDPTIKDVQGFNENLAPYKSDKRRWGFIDTLANIVIPAQFNGVGPFCGGLAWARNEDDLVGFINTEGKWVIQPRFKVVRSFDKESGMTSGTIKVMGPDGYSVWKWVYINAKGEILNFGDPEEVNFVGGFAIQRKGDLFGFIDGKGEWAIQPIYQGVRNFVNGAALVRENGRWGIIDKQGNWILTPRFAGVKAMAKLKW